MSHRRRKATSDAACGRSRVASGQRLHWYQFTLRSLLLLIVVASLGFAWLRTLFCRYEQEFQAVCDFRRSTSLFIGHDTSNGNVMRSVFSLVLGKDYRPVIELGPSGDTGTTFCAMAQTIHIDFDSETLSPIRHLRNLRVLDLGNNRVTDAALEHVGELSNLEAIFLHGDSVTGNAFQHWHGLTKLRTLYLEETSVDDTTLAHLKKLTSLESLVLEARVTDNGLKHLSSLDNLRSLLLIDLPITDEGLLQLRQIRSLRELSLLDNTNVTERGVDELRKAMPNVTVDYP